MIDLGTPPWNEPKGIWGPFSSPNQPYTSTMGVTLFNPKSHPRNPTPEMARFLLVPFKTTKQGKVGQNKATLLPVVYFSSGTLPTQKKVKRAPSWGTKRGIPTPKKTEPPTSSVDSPYLKVEVSGGSPNSISPVFPRKGKMTPEMEFNSGRNPASPNSIFKGLGISAAHGAGSRSTKKSICPPLAPRQTSRRGPCASAGPCGLREGRAERSSVFRLPTGLRLGA